MFDERPEGAGTDAPPEVESPEAPTTTGDDATGSDANGNDGDGKIEIPRREYLAIKQARENEKKLQARVEQLEAERGKAAPPTAPSPEADEQRSRVEEREQILAELKLAAFPPKGAVDAEGNPLKPNRDAKALYYVHQDALDAERRQLYRMEMADVPEARRDEVKKYMAENGLRSPAVAHRLLRGDQAGGLEAELAAARERIAELEKKTPREAPKDTRVTGGGPRRPAAGGPEQIDNAEYKRRMAENPNKTIADRRAKKFVLID